MVPAERGLAHGRDALSLEPGQQQGGLHLCGRHVNVPGDPRKASTPDRHGKKSVPAGEERRAHLLQGLNHPGHGSHDQGMVAGHGRDSFYPGADAAQKPRGGARVARVDHRCGLAETSAYHTPGVSSFLDSRAQGFERPSRASHVERFQRAANDRGALRQRAEHERPVRYGLVSGHSDFTGYPHRDFS